MNRRGWILFVTVASLWGAPYLFIKVVVEELPPVWVALARLLLSVAVLTPIALYKGAFRGLRRRIGSLLALGLAMAVLPFWLIAAGEQHVDSGTAALLVATQPVFIVLLGRGTARGSDPAERLTARRTAGLAVGLAGVAILASPTVAGGGAGLLGAGMVLLGSLSYAVGVLVIRHRFAGCPPLGTTAAAHAMAAVVLIPFGLIDLPTQGMSINGTVGLVVLGTACTAAAFLSFAALIAASGAARAGVVHFVSPVVAAVLGVIVLSEPVTLPLAAGSVLVLLGSWLATRSAATPAAAPREPRSTTEPANRYEGSPSSS
ncbi:DMT family transporter [Streptomyces sp. NPDC007861]|uniref:DMT family transporter n=1 Tax=Streptomyces sp. NPDC007861 TaxID=3154893 RepID=UPI0033C2D8C8